VSKFRLVDARGSRSLCVVLGVVASLVLPGCGTQAHPPSPTVTIGHWTGRRPVVIAFSGDGGNIATHLTWSSWNANGALGHGTRDILGCVPDCASGSATPYPVTITLSEPNLGQFTHMVERTMDTSNSGAGNLSTYVAPFSYINAS
jgi:hypothetical protein